MLKLGLLLLVSGCALAGWSGLGLRRGAEIERLIEADREAALGPITKALAAAVTMDPTGAKPPPAGSIVIVTGHLRAATPPVDAELGVRRPGAVALVRVVSRFGEYTVERRREALVRLRSPGEGPKAGQRDYLTAPDDYRTTTETVRHTRWEPVEASGPDHPLFSRSDRPPLRLGELPVTAALARQVSAAQAVALDEAQLARMRQLTNRPLQQENGAIRIGHTAQPAIGDHRIRLLEAPAGTYTILAVWDGRQLDVWSGTGGMTGLVRPGGAEDLIPARWQDQAAPVNSAGRLGKQWPLVLGAVCGTLISLAGAGVIVTAWRHP